MTGESERTTAPPAIVRARDRTKVSGAYDIDILNALGRDAKDSRNMLYERALSSPTGYLAQRNKAMKIVIDDQIGAIFKVIRDLLQNGEMEGKGQVLHFPDGKTEFRPKVPEATILKFAMGASKTIEDLFEKAFEECFPEDHKNLAIKKMTDLNKTAGLQ
jgi:hypothetical protein